MNSRRRTKRHAQPDTRIELVDFPGSIPYSATVAALPVSGERPFLSASVFPDPAHRSSARFRRTRESRHDRTIHRHSSGTTAADPPPRRSRASTPRAQSTRTNRETTGGLSRRRAQPDTRIELVDFPGSSPYSATVAALPVSGERPLRSLENECRNTPPDRSG